MTRRNLILAITEESGLQQLQVKRIVQKILEAIVDALIEDRRVELRNFGVFELRYWKARNGRNPSTGEKIRVPGHYTVILKPGKAVEKRISEECCMKTVGQAVPE